MGRGRRRRNSSIPKWPMVPSKGAFVASAGPDGCEDGLAGGGSSPRAPSEPSLSPPAVYSPESPLSSCSLSSTF